MKKVVTLISQVNELRKQAIQTTQSRTELAHRKIDLSRQNYECINRRSKQSPSKTPSAI
jgi:hypothetical protein